MCYRCAAENSHIAPHCHSGKVYCHTCGSDSHSTKAHAYQEKRKRVDSDSSKKENKKKKKKERMDAACRAAAGGGVAPAATPPVAPAGSAQPGEKNTPAVALPAGSTQKTCALIDDVDSDRDPPLIMESESDEEFVCRIRGSGGEAGARESVKVYSETDSSDEDEGRVTHQFQKTASRTDRCSLKRKLRAARTKAQVSQLFEKVNRIGNRD